MGRGRAWITALGGVTTIQTAADGIVPAHKYGPDLRGQALGSIDSTLEQRAGSYR
jgi:hypothetical protein